LIPSDDGRFTSWWGSCATARRSLGIGDLRPLNVLGEHACCAGIWRSYHKFTRLRHETVMTIQFSKQPIAVLSKGLHKMGSGLIRRLVCAQDDPGKERFPNEKSGQGVRMKLAAK
jgi:hypothetical protein